MDSRELHGVEEDYAERQKGCSAYFWLLEMGTGRLTHCMRYLYNFLISFLHLLLSYSKVGTNILYLSQAGIIMLIRAAVEGGLVVHLFINQ